MLENPVSSEIDDYFGLSKTGGKERVGAAGAKVQGVKSAWHG